MNCCCILAALAAAGSQCGCGCQNNRRPEPPRCGSRPGGRPGCGCGGNRPSAPAVSYTHLVEDAAVDVYKTLKSKL